MLPTLLTDGSPAMWLLWLLVVISGVAIVVFVERLLHCHRAQINSAEFLNGVRTVLRRDNVVEAVSICEATPGPVARLVKTAILARPQGREYVRESIEDAGLVEVPRLESRLDLLATIAQITPLLGLLGTVLGLIQLFMDMGGAPQSTNFTDLANGIWQALVCAGAGLAVAIPAQAAHNYLVNRVNLIVLDMERASNEILRILSEPAGVVEEE